MISIIQACLLIFPFKENEELKYAFPRTNYPINFFANCLNLVIFRVANADLPP
jgi:hypothetical protein